MTLKQFIDELADRLKVQNKEDGTVRAILARKINEGGKEVGRVHDWDCLKAHSQINCVENYSAGTVTTTNGSRTVTGSGTTWTSAMVGRYFKSSAGDNWYRIVRFVSTTELTLETPVTESSGGGRTYDIWKRFYHVPSLFRSVKVLGKWIGEQRLEQRDAQHVADRSPQETEGEPTDAYEAGSNEFAEPYTTGTVSMTKDENVLTGSGTSWLGNVEPGERIVVGTRTLRVKRVESDTRIVMFNHAPVTIAPGLSQTYRIEEDNPIGFQFYPAPDDEYVIPVFGFMRVFDLVNEDRDRFPFPEEFDAAILDAAEASRMRELDDVKWVQKQLELKGRITDLKAAMRGSKSRLRIMKPEIPSRGRI